MAKSITIIGSTGSIGTQALDIIRHRPDDFEVLALSAGRNLKLLIDQIKEFRPQYITVLSDEDRQEIKNLFPEITVLRDIKELAALENIDIVLSAIVGIAGLEANLIALQNAKRVAVANKETLVAAGHIVNEYCTKYNSELIPIDSEHAAIHQCLYNNLDFEATKNKKEEINSSVKEILLTSSGGPFRTLDASEFKNIKLADALKHPNWSMGQKITIDSSTLMNKALEVIEVNSLFGTSHDQIKVVIHPQSIVHSAVTFVDGNTIAQLGDPDMRVPIQYSLDYPDKNPLATKDSFDIFRTETLEFYEPDLKKFPALGMGYEALRLGGSFPTVLNSANEAATSLFMQEKIHYLDIAKIIGEALSGHKIVEKPSLEEILSIDKELKISINGKYSNLASNEL